ncbi:MAG: HAMP domain-containing sensor histidine kinase [Planctomycetota bacterium]
MSPPAPPTAHMDSGRDVATRPPDTDLGRDSAGLPELPAPLAPRGARAGKPYALVVLLQLHWFIRLRWIFAAGTLAVLAVERFVTPQAERPPHLWLAVLSVAGINVVWTLLSRPMRRQLDRAGDDHHRAIRAGQLFASAQIATDLFLLTWILALTGGVENPMSVFYLFHVAISGLLLRTWQAFMWSCWAVLLYGGMCLAQALGWLPFYPFLPQLGSVDLYTQGQHVALVVLVVAAAVFGTLYFTDRIGALLDQREAMLIRMNAALEQSRQAIHDLQRRRARFMQHAAHQLKSPLAMVQTFANLIRDGIVTDAAGIQATCEKIIRRSREGIAQVTELLALARVQESDPRRHRACAADVGRIVQEICQRHLPVAQEKGLQMTCDVCDGQSLLAQVDPADLIDCAGNLVENAIKYTPAGGAVRVTVTGGAQAGHADLPPPPATADGRQLADYVFVIVADTGIGIDLDEPHLLRSGGTLPGGTIFDAFRRGNNALALGIPGTGLGLSIVREVVEQAAGYIDVRSCRGQGSTFTVAFPAATAAPVAALNTRSSRIIVAGGGTGPDASARPS